MSARPRVVVIFTGGTIAMLPGEDAGAAVPALRGGDVLARVPELDRIADIEAIDWGLVPASHLRFSQILEIGELIRGASGRADVSGAGPAVYGLFERRADAERAAASLRRAARTWIAEPVEGP